MIFILSMSFYFFPSNAFLSELKLLKKWERINSLISEELNSILKSGPIGEEKYFRVLELYSEKLNILKKKENYLSMKKNHEKFEENENNDLKRILITKKKTLFKNFKNG